MQNYEHGEEWMRVSRRRGRERRHYDGGARSTSPGKYTYASVIKTGGQRGLHLPRHRREELDFLPEYDERGWAQWPQKTRNDSLLFTGKSSTHTQVAAHPTHTKKRVNHQKKSEMRGKSESRDLDFVLKVRIMHKVIKITHHLNNVSTTHPPHTIQKCTNNLATMIKPANPTTKTQELIEGNAKNWQYTTILILQDHYNLELKKELDRLNLLDTAEWREPFGVATSWAKKNLKRLQDETLEQAQALIVAQLGDNVGTDRRQEVSVPPQSSYKSTHKHSTHLTTNTPILQTPSENGLTTVAWPNIELDSKQGRREVVPIREPQIHNKPNNARRQDCRNSTTGTQLHTGPKKQQGRKQRVPITQAPRHTEPNKERGHRRPTIETQSDVEPNRQQGREQVGRTTVATMTEEGSDRSPTIHREPEDRHMMSPLTERPYFTPQASPGPPPSFSQMLSTVGTPPLPDFMGEMLLPTANTQPTRSSVAAISPRVTRSLGKMHRARLCLRIKRIPIQTTPSPLSTRLGPNGRINPDKPDWSLRMNKQIQSAQDEHG